MQVTESLIQSKNQGRKKTTGKFKARSELIEKLVSLKTTRNMSVCSAARICGVSAVTAAKLLKDPESNLSQSS